MYKGLNVHFLSVLYLSFYPKKWDFKHRFWVQQPKLLIYMIPASEIDVWLIKGLYVVNIISKPLKTYFLEFWTLRAFQVF